MSNSIIVRKSPVANVSLSQGIGNSLTILKSGSLSVSLPPATNSTIGGIIVGDNLSITGNGVLSVANTFQPKTSCVTYGLTDTLLPNGPNTFYVVGEHVVQSGQNFYTGLRGRKTSAGVYQNATSYGVGGYTVDSNGTPTALSTLETSASALLLSSSNLTASSIASTISVNSAGYVAAVSSNGSPTGCCSLTLQDGSLKAFASASAYLNFSGSNVTTGVNAQDYKFRVAGAPDFTKGVSLQRVYTTSSLIFPYIVSNGTGTFDFSSGFSFYDGDPLSAATEFQHKYTNRSSNVTSSTTIRLVSNNAELSYAQMTQVKTSNSILTQGYADSRYPLLNPTTGQRILSQQESQQKYAKLDFGIPTGTVSLSATDAAYLQVIPYNGTVADQSYLTIKVTKNDAIIEFENKTWTDNSILTRVYADTRYLTSANLTPYLTIANANSNYSVLGHTHAIANVTGLQTALDAKLSSANFTYANLTGTPTLATVATTGSYTDLSNTPTSYSLPTASTTLLGGVRVDGSTITIASGVISAVSSSYTLPMASASTLGGVRIGSGISVDQGNGFLNTDVRLTTNTFTGTQNLGGNLLTQAKLQAYRETSTAPTISAGSLTLDLSGSNFFAVSLNAAISTIAISNIPSGSVASFTLEFTGTGVTYSVNWALSSGAIKWAGAASAPTITATSGKKDVFCFYTTDGGANWLGFIGGQNY